MTSDEIREAFLKFFEEKRHSRIPSSSLVPHGDPTLLLTNAGMVQIKPYFLGEATPPNTRLTSSQKCFRTTDIEKVGDSSHLTFFEMLGNFSVGDYFKREAINWAWEFVTQRLGLPSERLFTTVFTDDDEAYDLWREIGVPAERIFRYGEAEGNWWGPAGETGPTGPCSEIHFDFGAESGCRKPGCGPSCDCDRFLELWNLVFMQYYQDEQKVRTPLPTRNIDTGMGLERLATLLQGMKSVYETDIFSPIIDQVSRLTGKTYGQEDNIDRAIRVVAEHSRSVTFLCGDGVIPGNEGRGYVLRRVLRRAVRFGRLLGLDRPFIGVIAEVVIDKMGHIYPELAANRNFILRVINIEEARFNLTLSTGLSLLDTIIQRVLSSGQPVIPGDEVFRLYDTYGFPKELTAEVAEEQGLSIDDIGFWTAMERQREMARSAAKFGLADKQMAERYEPLGIERTHFAGYERLIDRSPVRAIIVDGQATETAFVGQDVEIVLARTPFYAESGGQVADKGVIITTSGRIAVRDTQKPLPEVIVHIGRVEEGFVSVGEEAEATVDVERRLDIGRNHTATHLLHAALRDVLGPHVHQSGSLVTPDRFRFDFTHLAAVTRQELEQVESIVNQSVRQNLVVRTTLKSYAEAVAEGALAFFEDKYGEQVRMVEVYQPREECALADEADVPIVGGQTDQGSDKENMDAPFSRELCGGTHLKRTGEIGAFFVVADTSIGAGARRIEALAGRGAERWARERISTLDAAARLLQVAPTEVPAKSAALLSEMADLRRQVEAAQRLALKREIDSLLAQAQSVDGVNVLSAKVPAQDVESMREMSDWIRDRLGSAVIVLGANLNGRPSFIATVTRDLVAKGLHAGKIIQEVAKVAGGGGGGRPEMAQAGGKDADKLDDALKIVLQLVKI
ncbi:MAG: alanine--tRNA ligase [Dehalococcoidia bacterium]|nr:alanine--tRNA ligase [Dehalococcoidia bacterium]